LGFVRSMVDSDPREGIKVVAVCPGYTSISFPPDYIDMLTIYRFTRTPIFTPETEERFGLNQANSILPDVVASRMADLVELGKYEGGTILEVSAAWTRTIGTFNITPPKSEGSAIPQNFIQKSISPIVELLRKERNVDR